MQNNPDHILVSKAMLLGWSRVVGLVVGTWLTVTLCFLLGWNGFAVQAFHAHSVDFIGASGLVLGLAPFVGAVWLLREGKE